MKRHDSLLAALSLVSLSAAQGSVGVIDPTQLAELNAQIPACAVPCIVQYAPAYGCTTDFDQTSDTCICSNGPSLKTAAQTCLQAACTDQERDG